VLYAITPHSHLHTINSGRHHLIVNAQTGDIANLWHSFAWHEYVTGVFFTPMAHLVFNKILQQHSPLAANLQPEAPNNAKPRTIQQRTIQQRTIQPQTSNATNE
jgi:hypothetical protein